MDKITKEEYAEAIEWANRPTDETATREEKEIVARVLLALAGAWGEVPETCCGLAGFLCASNPAKKDCANCSGGKRSIAARHGLPVSPSGQVDGEVGK